MTKIEREQLIKAYAHISAGLRQVPKERRRAGDYFAFQDLEIAKTVLSELLTTEGDNDK